MTTEDQQNPDVTELLFAGSIPKTEYPADDYYPHLLEQYKIYLESAEQVSNRRGIANSFFSTLSVAFLTIIVEADSPESITDFILPIIGLVISITWFLIIREYRSLNDAKYKVIGALETRLPSSPMVGAEWPLLQHGKGKKYLTLSKVEWTIPAVFACLHLIVLWAWICTCLTKS